MKKTQTEKAIVKTQDEVTPAEGKKLVLSLQTLKRLVVRTGIQAGEGSQVCCITRIIPG